MTVMNKDKARNTGLRTRLQQIALMAFAAAAVLFLETPARATSFANGNFALTSDSSLANGQAIHVLGGTGTGYGYGVTDWAQRTSSTCPSGSSTPNNGNAALAFVYTNGSQADTS